MRSVRHVRRRTEVLAGRARGDTTCALAFDVCVHTLVREIGAMAAGAGGIDVLVSSRAVSASARRR